MAEGVARCRELTRVPRFYHCMAIMLKSKEKQGVLGVCGGLDSLVCFKNEQSA